MIVAKDFVYIHVPKTGGTWLSNAFQHAPPEWFARVAEPIHGGSQHAPALPSFGFIRNPWDWYVSLYFFMDGMYRNRRAGFANVEQAAASDRLWARWMPIIDAVPPGDPGFEVALELALRNNSQADLSDRLQDLDGVDVLKFEGGVREQTEEWLSRHVQLTPAFRGVLAHSPKLYESGHLEYRGYYSYRTRVLVEAAERAVISRFGYEF